MFEKFHLITVTLQGVLRTNEDIMNLNPEGTSFDLGEAYSEDMSPLHAEFAITGTLSTLPPKPLSRFARESCLFIQSFGYMASTLDYFTKRQDYSSLLILYTYEGAGKLDYEGVTYTLEPGTGFLIDCRKPHYYFSCAENWCHSDLHIWGAQAPDIYQRFGKDSGVVFHTDTTAQYNQLLNRALISYTMISPNRDLYCSSDIMYMLCEILKLNENQKEIPDTYQYLIRYMENNYMQELSLDYLSHFANLSKYHLAREFKKYVGFTPHDYLIGIRMSHAEFLLQTSHMTVEDIANQVGFSNQANFIRLFRKRSQMTPTQFRHLHLSE